MQRIFISECDPDQVCQAYWGDEQQLQVFTVTRLGRAPIADLCKEDAEALARAILGLPDLPFFDWDGIVNDMKAAVALEEIARRREGHSMAHGVVS